MTMYNPEFVRKVHEKRRREAERARKEEDLAAKRRRREERRIYAEGALIKRLERKAEKRISKLFETLRTEPQDIIRIKVQRVIDTTAGKYGLRPEDIIGRSKQPHIVHARHEAILKVSRIDPRPTSVQIGQFFGNRDHASILYVLKKRPRKEAA